MKAEKEEELVSLVSKKDAQIENLMKNLNERNSTESEMRITAKEHMLEIHNKADSINELKSRLEILKSDNGRLEELATDSSILKQKNQILRKAV